LKKVFSSHLTASPDKITFSEFQKFCKQTQIFPNFVSAIQVKKIVGSTQKQEEPVTSNYLISYIQFERCIKELSYQTFKSNISPFDKVQAFFRHLNVNCQAQYGISSLVIDLPRP